MWVDRNGKVWRIRDRVNGKIVEIETGYPTKTAAKTAMINLQSDQLKGDLITSKDGQRTVKEWAEEWWLGHKIGLKPNTIRSESSRLECHVVADLGDVRLADLTPAIVQMWVADMVTEGLGAKSVHNIHGLLHTVMGYAVDNRLVRSNPCERTKLPIVVHREMKFLNEVEAQRLLDAMPERFRDVVLTFLGTGMRFGELAGLQVRRFDAFTRSLMVVESLVDRGLVLGTPKSRSSRRPITVPENVLSALVARTAGKAGLEWIFQQPLGGPLRYNYFYQRIWQPAIAEAGLPGLRIHDLRHTHAAWLISANMPLTAIQRRLGHKSIAVTSDRYGHLLPEVDDDIVAALDLALRGQSPRSKLGAAVGSQVSTHACSCSITPAQAA